MMEYQGGMMEYQGGMMEYQGGMMEYQDEWCQIFIILVVLS